MNSNIVVCIIESTRFDKKLQLQLSRRKFTLSGDEVQSRRFMFQY
jgi:hypothetical protein